MIPLRSEPALESLFASLLPYTDARVKPLPEWIEYKRQGGSPLPPDDQPEVLSDAIRFQQSLEN